MRATNLGKELNSTPLTEYPGFKSPREIFHAPFQIPNVLNYLQNDYHLSQVDYYGRTIQTRAKSRSSSQKPRAKTADRFNNQYVRLERNISLNIFDLKDKKL
mgnify:CR=1 FL=1